MFKTKLVRCVAIMGIAGALVLPTAARASHGGGVACNTSYDPYSASLTDLEACGVPIYPLQSTKPLSDGGKEYIYAAGGVTMVHRVPPAGFNPLTASDDELDYYDLPRRPAAGPALDHWKDMMIHQKMVAPPPYLVGSHVSTLVLSRGSIPSGGSGDQSYNWSGYVANAGSGTNAYYYVQGVWTEVNTDPNACPSNAAEVTWAGIWRRRETSPTASSSPTTGIFVSRVGTSPA